MPAAATYCLRLGDDSLVLCQRLSEWSTRAPELEEDVALTNLGLDLLGQARALLSRAGELEGRGRGEDALAFRRDEREFLNCQMVEQPNGDFAETMARLLLFSAYQHQLYAALADSTDPVIAAIAERALKEVAYHRDHASLWTLRLGDGTEESHRRMQAGLEAVWPFSAELFESDPLTVEVAACGVGVDPPALLPGWESYVNAVITEATLTVPQPGWFPSGGRRGLHTESFGYLLAEMQHLHRSHPEAQW